MPTDVLVLHPRDARYAPRDAAAIVRCLEDSGLARDMQITTEGSSAGERRSFRTGPRFEELIVFADADRKRLVFGPGPASPKAVDTAEFVRDICRLVLVGPLEREVFLCSAHTDDPRCPRCGGSADWNEIGNEWSFNGSHSSGATASGVACSACGERMEPWRFEWRGTAGFARVYLQIAPIASEEAKPSDELLEQLATATGTPWVYLHYRF